MAITHAYRYVEMCMGHNSSQVELVEFWVLHKNFSIKISVAWLRFLFEVYNEVYYRDVFRWLLWSKWEIFGCKIGQFKRLYLNCFPRHSLIFPVLRCQPFTLYYLGHFHHINVTPSGAHSSPDCLSFLHVTWIAAVLPTSVSFFLLLSEYSTSLFPVTFDSVVVRATPVWLSLYDEFSHFGGSSDYFILV